jgi:hypothetical protein
LYSYRVLDEHARPYSFDSIDHALAADSGDVTAGQPRDVGPTYEVARARPELASIALIVLAADLRDHA